ncbi:MAG: UDP-N-acetylmuramoyl-tripeptide--D-alanyl-D-alanine ligase [Oscillospiraceae bacterium]|nr:UDP-N-acetylmuramoyl-tripeptide--D-alanyl-D-alanine ligase [Oscillospiraceae bacterium]
MEHLTPKIIANITNGEVIGNPDDFNNPISGAVRDSREVKAGNLFVCIEGTNADGHSFANNAFESGAACCLAQKTIPDAQGPYVLVSSTLEAIKKVGEYHRSLFNIPIIGITGSVGKTTTKEMTATVLESKFNVLKTPDNLNNELGVPLTLLLLDESHDAAVIEMGISDFGEMSRLAQMVKPDICIITQIGYSHLETLGSLKGVLEAKSEVFAFMNPNGKAILNGDNELLKNANTGMSTTFFGMGEHNDVRAENITQIGTEKVKFDVLGDFGSFDVKIASYGSHLPMAALAAVAAGRILGLSNEEIQKGLMTYAPLDGRSNIKDTAYITLIDDCYNANPNSVMAALTSLSMLNQRRVAILGDMLDLGEQSDELHGRIGAFAWEKGVDSLICCGEKAKFIYDEYLSAGGDLAKYYSSKASLMAALPNLIKKGDAVLVKASHGMMFEELLPILEKM